MIPRMTIGKLKLFPHIGLIFFFDFGIILIRKFAKICALFDCLPPMVIFFPDHGIFIKTKKVELLQYFLPTLQMFIWILPFLPTPPNVFYMF